MKKILIGIAVVLAVVLVGLALFIKFGTEPTIKYAVESQGTAFTDTKVGVKNVDLSLFGGSLSLSGITLQNPKGFTSPDAMSLGQVRVDVDRNSLFSKEIVINRILLDKPSITFERGQGSSNLEILKKAIDSHVPKSQSGESPVTVLVRELLVKNAQLNYNLKPGAKLKSLVLPDARVANIGTGKGSGGVSVQVAVDQIVNQMMPVVVSELARAEGVDAVKGILKDPGQFKDILGKDVLKGDALKGGVGGVKETIEKGVGDVIKGLPK